MKKFLFLCSVLAFFSASCATQQGISKERGLQVICKVGNEQAKPGPGFGTLGTKPEPSRTVVTFHWGELPQKRKVSSSMNSYGWINDLTCEAVYGIECPTSKFGSANTFLFQYGVELPADYLRKHSVAGRLKPEATDAEILKAQQEHPSSADFLVTGLLHKESKTIEFNIERSVNPLGEHIGEIIGDTKKTAIIPESKFGSPYIILEDPMLGSVGIICTGHF